MIALLWRDSLGRKVIFLYRAALAPNASHKVLKRKQVRISESDLIKKGWQHSEKFKPEISR